MVYSMHLLEQDMVQFPPGVLPSSSNFKKRRCMHKGQEDPRVLRVKIRMEDLRCISNWNRNNLYVTQNRNDKMIHRQYIYRLAMRNTEKF
jgi:hypothetical protein